jgi:hypothetical protein
MRRLPRHSRRWSPAVLRLVGMKEKVVPERGSIHYLAGNRPEKRTRQNRPIFGPCAFVMRKGKTAVSITSEVIASRVATTDFADIVNQRRESLLVLPVTLMREAGMVLIPYVILVTFVASRPTPTRGPKALLFGSPRLNRMAGSASSVACGGLDRHASLIRHCRNRYYFDYEVRMRERRNPDYFRGRRIVVTAVF